MRPLVPALLLSLALATTAAAQTSSAASPRRAPLELGLVDHSAWEALLREHVSEGLVDYQGLLGERDRLDAYVALLAETNAAALPEDEALAFWINAYNARMVQLVLDHYPIRGRDGSHPRNSVLQVDGIFKKFPTRIGRRSVSLDAIEHEILRKDFDEPRIHAAIVCASGSCPELRAEAFVAEHVDRQLDEQMRAFLADPRRNQFDLEAGVARLSKIFDWFREDFPRTGESAVALNRVAGKDAGILEFAVQHVPQELAVAIVKGRFRVEFLPYDWGLNDQASPPSFGR